MTVGNTLKLGFEKNPHHCSICQFSLVSGIYMVGSFSAVRNEEHKGHQSIEVENVFLIRLEGTVHSTCK